MTDIGLELIAEHRKFAEANAKRVNRMIVSAFLAGGFTAFAIFNFILLITKYFFT